MNRREFIGSAAATLAAGCVEANPAAKGAADSLALEAAKKWFKEAQFGMMAHWGLYTLLGGEWKGKPGFHPYGEWIMHGNRIPLKEYAALAKAFNPTLFDPMDWMKRARDAGMKYFVITSKHHDGFAMYRSKASKYNVVDATPFGRDPIEEIAEACRATGVKLGLYYSQDLDWSERNGGGEKNELGKKNWGPDTWRNCWDWPSLDGYDFSKYFEGKCKPQVKEILTQYGDLCLIWFDTPETISKAQSTELRDLVRTLQPGCLISGRIGNGMGDYETPGDNELFGKTDPGKLYETVGTMNDSWGYKPTDTNYKSVETILKIKGDCAAKGVNYLLNFGPDPLGRIPTAAIDILDGLKGARKA